MAKPEIYVGKIEKARTCEIKGFRIKQYMYNIVRSCYKPVSYTHLISDQWQSVFSFSLHIELEYLS